MAKFSDMLKKENQNSTTSVSNTQSTGTKFSDYLKQGSSFNSYKSDIAKSQNVINNYPNRNDFKTNEAYNAQVLKTNLDNRFSGYSYDRVKSAMNNYSPDSDEYKYLSTYTNYTDLNDFDKALKDVEDVDTNGIYDRLKASMGLSGLLLGNDDSDSDLKNYKESLQQKRNQYALDHAFDNYKGMMEEEGFDGSYDSSINDEFYRAVNGDKTAKDRITARNVSTVGNIGLDYVSDKYSDYSISMMTDEEKAVYNYLYSRSSKEADDYLNSIKASLNKREYDSTSRIYDMASDGLLGGAVMSALSIPMNVIGGVSSGAENIKDFILGIQNPYAKGNYSANLASDIRENVSQNIADATGSNVYPFLYQTGMSIGDSLLGVNALGKAYTVAMGANAYQQKYREAIEAGETEEKAQASAIASGVAESIFEKFSLDTLLKPKGADGWRAVVKSALQQAGVEASEEAFTELSNKLTDTLVRMNTSDVANQAKELKRRGYTDSEIAMEITSSVLGDVALSALGGALSGGLLGAGAGAFDYNQNSKTGKAISSKGNSEDLFALAENSKEGSELYDLYTEYSNKGVTGENATNAQLGNLYNTADRQNYTDFQNALYDKNRENDDEIIRQSAIREDLNNIYDVALNKPIESKSVQKVDSVQNVDGVNSEEEITRQEFEKEEALAKAKYNGERGIGIESLMTLTKKAKLNDLISSYKEGEFVRQAEDKVKEARQKIANESARKLSTDAQIDTSILSMDGSDKSKIDFNGLTKRQQGSIEFTSLFLKGLGANLEFVSSTVDEKGKRIGYNGLYNRSNNTFYIDVYAGLRYTNDPKGDLIIPVVSHEVTHWLEVNAPELYTQLRKTVTGIMISKGINIENAIAKEKERLLESHSDEFNSVDDISDDYALSEIVARSCEDMLSNSEYLKEMVEQMPEEARKTFVERVRETLNNFIKFVTDLLKQYNSKSPEAVELRKYKSDFENVLKDFDNALRYAVESNKGESIADIEAGLASISGQTITDGVSKDMNTIVSDTALQMSERTYAEGGRDYLVKWLKNRKGISQEEAEDILLQTDKIAELMKAVREGNDLPDYSKWANMDVVMAEDDKGKSKKVTVIVRNGDYVMNIDFSQVCKKRVALNRVLNQMVSKGILDNFIMGEADVSLLNSIIKEEGFEIACALCFVDSKRYRVGSWANSFCNGADEKDGNHKYGFNEMVKSLVPKGSKINVDEFNFTGRDIKNNPTTNLLSDMDDSKLDFTLIDSIMKNNDVRSAQHRWARAIKENASLRKTLNPAEIISSIGYDSIRAESPELFKLINSHQGNAKPKFSHDQVVYKNDILQASSMTAKKAYMVGGVRLQSFSDFMTNMVFDYVQMVSELSAKKLPVHTYTKEAIFVKLFGLTGMKINMSLVPKAIEMTDKQKKHFKPLFDPKPKKGEANYEQRIAEYNALEAEYESLAVNAGLDKKGNYIWEDETFPYDVAMDIVKDPEYSKNCGTIAVGISRNHIIKLLNDDTIHMVIPYHKSGLNHEVALMRNIALYHDYTSVQNTRYTRADGTVGKLEKGMKDFNFYEDLYKTKDPKQTAKNYLAFCDEHGYTPKFDEFAYNENYYKLLADFRLYDNDGSYAPQQAVKPIYPDLDTMKDLIVNGYTFNGVTYGGLKQQEKASADLRKKNDKIIDRWTSEMNEKAGKDLFHQYSDRDTDLENHFGTTSNYNVAGYMLKDGKMLDFSGKHWGDTTSKIRQVDHRDVSELLGGDGNSDMISIIGSGDIRLLPEDGGINLSVAPTAQQETSLKKYIDYMLKKNGSVTVDYDDLKGNTVYSKTYDKYADSKTIISDIANYFKGNKKSALADIYTQYSERDTEYMELAKDPEKNSEQLQKMVDEYALSMGANTDFKGNLNYFYHGSPLDFNSFDYAMMQSGEHGYGFYLTKSKEYAESYAYKDEEQEEFGRLIKAFIMSDRIATERMNNITIDQIKAFMDKYNIPDDYYRFKWYGGIEGFAEFNDVDILDNVQAWVLDDNPKMKEEVIRSLPGIFNYDGLYIGGEYVVFDNTLIKSAEPVSYDNAGNVIPLSERFNKSSDDIRFSDRVDEKYISDTAEMISSLYQSFDTYDYMDASFGEDMNDSVFLSLKNGDYSIIDDIMYEYYDDFDDEEKMVADEIIKRVDKIKGSKVQYSDRDSEYLELAKDPKKNESQLQSMVSQYAKANGYNSPILYHGTSNFGFTKLDTANSDDKFSFFVTDSLDTAKTYAYNSGVRSASDYKGEITRYDLGVAEEKMLKSAEKLLKVLGKKPTSLDTLGVIASIGQSTDLSYIESKVRSYIEGDIENADKVEKAVNNLIKSAYTHNMYLDMYEKGSNGVYSFYGNTEGFYEIDAKGKSWAHIEAGDALSKYVTNENRKNSDGSYTVSTREIAKYAYESGYPGVIIRNVVDNGGKGKEAGTSTVYAFFNPSQDLKSADPVTYDNKGKVIPLSERFNDLKDDIRYDDRPLSEMTSTEKNSKFSYESLIQRPDVAVTKINDSIDVSDNKEIVALAKSNSIKRGYGRKDGNSVKVYVPDVGSDITLTSGGLKHGLRRDKSVISSVTLNIGEILYNSIVLNELNPKYDNNADHQYVLYGIAETESGEKVVVRCLINSYTMNLEDISDYVYVDNLYAINAKKESAVAKPPRVISSSTDSNMSVSSLLEYVNYYLPDTLSESVLRHFGRSERPINSDTEAGNFALYSDRDESTVSKVLDVDTQNEINALLAEVENLNEKLKLDKQLTGGNVLNENQIKKVATRIKTLANSKYNTLQLVKDLTEIYNYLNNTVDVDATTVFGKFYELARAVAGEERATVIKDDYMNDISKSIINRKIKLTPEIESWLTNQYGKNFRQALRGLVYFGTNEGVNLDERWNSLSQMYPETFDYEISGEDQLQALIDIASSVKEASKQIQTFNTEETVKDIAYAMYDGYWDVSPLKTTADKYQARIDKLNREHSDQISRIKERNKGIADKQKQKDKEYYGKIIKNLRDQRDNARRDAKKRYDKMENTREKNRLVKSITDNTLALNKQLKANSVKQHVPESMKKVVVGLINSIDYSSKSLLGQNVETKKDMRISTALEQVKDMFYKMDAEQREGIFTIDIPTGYEKNVEDLTKALKVLEQNNNPYVLNDMSVDQLKELDKIVKIIKSSVNNMNKWNASTKGDFITDCEESMAEIDQNKTYVKSIDLVNKVRSEIVWREATPIYAFERFGKIGKKVFASIQDGWDKFAYNIADVKQYAEDTFSGKECDEWEKEIHTYDLHDSTVKISTAQLMSLYCLMKREHATNHVLTSGIKINDIKGKNNKVIINQEEAILLSKSEVDRMLADLTPRQLEVAEKLQKFMNTTCTDWGNEITMARYGFNAFEEKNYFPIKVNENHLDSEANDRENSFFRLLNLSFTNPLVKGANGSIEIDSIFNVFASHSSDMAKYNALALPVLDAYKWFSYRAKSDVESDDGSKQKKERSVKSSISKAFGKDGTSYISTFLKDLNGDKNVSREIFGKGLFSAGKMASVGFNARVVALQPTSYFRAMNILDADDLTIAFTKKNGYKKAEENCGIAMWKSLGFYDVNVGRGLTEMIKRNQTAFSKIQEASMMGAGKADEITIGYLWNACEHNVKKNNKNLSGKALDEATALKLRDVIYHTQVVDSTMTRSEIMRSSSYEDKLRTAFLSEPTLSLNMLMGSVYEYSLDAGKYGKSEAFKKNGKKIARAFTAYTITNLIASIVEAGFDALRSKKEELDEEELWNLWLENFKDDMSVLGKIPVIKDVISVFKGYSQNSIEFQSVTALYSAWKEIEKAMNGKKMSPYKFSSYMLKSISYMSGIALSNGDRDVKAVFNRTGLMTYDEMEDLFNKIIGSVFPFLKV